MVLVFTEYNIKKSIYKIKGQIYLYFGKNSRHFFKKALQILIPLLKTSEISLKEFSNIN